MERVLNLQVSFDPLWAIIFSFPYRNNDLEAEAFKECISESWSSTYWSFKE